MALAAFTPVGQGGADAYRRDAGELDKALRSLDDGMAWYAERTAPYPLTITDDDAAELARLYAAISRGIASVIAAHRHDERIRSILSLPSELIELLARAADLPYRTGALRPDFLVDEHGQLRICEVNARFPVNGFMCSYFTNEVVDDLSYLAGTPVRSVPGLRRTLDVLAGRFRAGEPLVVLLDRERGTEIFLFVDELRRRSIEVRTRRPDQLRVEGTTVYDGAQPVEQFILELERDELLALPIELFDALAACPRVFNDVRTLILGHDKRMLAVLSRRDVMADHLEADDVELLERHIIPTFHAAEVIDGLLAEPDRWVLKRNSSGRGIDLLVGATCPSADWRRAVLDEADDRAAQVFVRQRTFRLPVPNDRGELVDEPMHVVGLLPGFDGELFGPGLCRASAHSVINVAGGRGTLVPTMLTEEVQ